MNDTISTRKQINMKTLSYTGHQVPNSHFPCKNEIIHVFITAQRHDIVFSWDVLERPESNFSPFKLLDKVTAKSTEATQVVKTTTMKDVSRTPNVTSYEDNLSTSTSSIENGETIFNYVKIL